MAVTRLILDYDGTGFAGWARQPGQRTVQETVEAGLARVRGNRPVELTVAGRTDRGVHAWGQVASYPGEPVPADALNAVLPGDVAVLAADAMPDGFDARHDATSRTYCYRILNRRTPSAFERLRALHVPQALDRAALAACAASLVGRHDFRAFTPTETVHQRFERRVLRAGWRVADGGAVLEFWIEADAFMRHMNRILVGTMLQVARGRRTVDGFAALLAGRPRAEAGPTVPPHGLYFAAVGYADGEEPSAPPTP